MLDYIKKMRNNFKNDYSRSNIRLGSKAYAIGTFGTFFIWIALLISGILFGWLPSLIVGVSIFLLWPSFILFTLDLIFFVIR